MEKKITIFTATYNRQNRLKKLYDSLRRQTCHEFEGVIIDDASTDQTTQIVEQWINDDLNTFEIKYEIQKHGGKHRAINRGVKIAEGEYFFIVDSDDYLTPNAVEQVIKWIQNISEKDVVGVAGLKIQANGMLCGGINIPIGKEYITASNLERNRLGLNGDRAEVYKTSIMRKYPFPEFENEYFLTEAVCWNAIAASGKKVNWYADPIYVCEYLEEGLTKSGANEIPGRIKNFNGYCYYVRQSLKVKEPIESITDFRAYNRTCIVKKDNLYQRAKNLNMGIGEFLVWMFIKQPILYFCRIVGYRKGKNEN